MKILRPGFVQKYEGTCLFCNCKVEATSRDFTYLPNIPTIFNTAKCPTADCGGTIIVFKVKPAYSSWDELMKMSDLELCKLFIIDPKPKYNYKSKFGTGWDESLSMTND